MDNANNWLQVQVSVFSRCTSTLGEPINIIDVLRNIQNPPNRIKHAISEIRSQSDKKLANTIKARELPALTFSGILKTRDSKVSKEDKVLSFSGLSCLDFDNIINVNEVKSTLSMDPYVASVFISPGGKGLKVIVKISQPELYLQCWQAAANYFNEKYNLTVDVSTKDITRLCYISYDPNIYINNGVVNEFLPVSNPAILPISNLPPPPFAANIPEGGRNNYLTSIAGTMRRKGITESAILSALFAENDARCLPPLDEFEVKKIAKSISKYTPENTEQLRTPFPVRSLPTKITEYCVAASESIGCPIEMIVLPVLVALGGSIGKSRIVEIKSGWTEPATIWAAIIARSGQHKTPSMEQAFLPLKEEQKSNWKKYQIEKELWNSQKTSQAKNESMLPAPILKQTIVDDTTVEALAEIFMHNSNGLILAKDELSGWLKSFERYNSGDTSSSWLSMHTSGNITINRKTSQPIFIEKATLSIFGGIQPEIFHSDFQGRQTHNGMLARFLLAEPEPRPRRWQEKYVDPNIEEDYRRIVHNLKTLSVGISQPQKLTLSEEAKEIFILFYNSNGSTMLMAPDNEGAAQSKLEAYVARLALIFELVVDPNSHQISKASMLQAISCVEWFVQEMRIIYRNTLNNDNKTKSQSAKDDLLNILQPTAMQRKCVVAKCVELGHKERTIDRAFNELLSEGKVRADSGCWMIVMEI